MWVLEREKGGELRRTKREPDELDNHHTQGDVGNWENDEYQANWGPDK